MSVFRQPPSFVAAAALFFLKFSHGISRVDRCTQPRFSFALASSVSGVPTVTLPPTHNRFLMLRHGQSTANLAGIISSDADSLMYSSTHGLSPMGATQAAESAREVLAALRKSRRGGKILFYSSPFARARQTAEICQKKLRNLLVEEGEAGWTIMDGILLDEGLRERSFGRLDGMKLYTYAYVWPVDLFLPTHTGFGVESVHSVASRVAEAVTRIDRSLPDRDGDEESVVVLAGHADTLQILQVLAAGVDVENLGTFSSYRFRNGEVREMGRDTSTLPQPQPMIPPKKGT